MMITIEGSHGEGGGQIIRSSVALSLVTGVPVTVEKIRARRAKPGLRRQHLTAVRAAAQVGAATVEGAEIGSSRLVFQPHGIHGGTYFFRIGTAGSTTLVLQTVLPALLAADKPSHVTLEGGTHNPLAPPFEFLDRCYLPLLRRLGHQVEVTLDRHGFFPAGGGRMTLTVEPGGAWRPLNLLERGRVVRRDVCALLSQLPDHIGERECSTAVRKLGFRGNESRVRRITDSSGPGNVLLIEIESEHVTEIVAGFGQRGVKAERVATMAAREARHYLDAGVPVGEHLADQLLLPLAIGATHGAGGSFRTLALSGHSTTHIELLEKLLDVNMTVAASAPDDVLVTVEPPS
ncbi:MAG: RNA 3'-terminal phosphate cyclase [Pirellulaceae bacterium]